MSSVRSARAAMERDIMERDIMERDIMERVIMERDIMERVIGETSRWAVNAKPSSAILTLG
jgi:hypothetical protein